MNEAPIVAGIATEDIANLNPATHLRIADKSCWSNQDFAWVIAHLEAKATRRAKPNIPPKRASPKRRRVPFRTWPI
jgi:hypothetical protein